MGRSGMLRLLLVPTLKPRSNSANVALASCEFRVVGFQLRVRLRRSPTQNKALAKQSNIIKHLKFAYQANKRRGRTLFDKHFLETAERQS